MPVIAKRKLLILLLPQEWERYHRRPYWEALAKNTPVLVVKPPAGILSFWLHPKRIWDYFSKEKSHFQKLTNLYFIRPLLLVTPGIDFRFPLFAAIDRFWMRIQIRKAINKLKFERRESVLFLVHVQQSLFSGQFGDLVQCYEITDLYTIALGHHRIDKNHWYTRRALRENKRIVDESDVVISSSKVIHNELRTLHSNVHYLQNAADFGHFSKSSEHETEIPNDIKDLRGKKIGFIGYLNHLIDFELLCHLANQLPEAFLILIGSEQNETGIQSDHWFQKTKTAKNIHYLGFREYERLPAYLKAFDVTLMPFRLNDWMMHSAPNKVYQYLASGKPVVSTDFTEVRQYENVIYVAKNHQDFIEKVKAALNENDVEKISARLKVARDNSTEKRAIKVIDLVNSISK